MTNGPAGSTPGVKGQAVADEVIRASLRAEDALLTVTDRRLVVKDGERVLLDVLCADIRRVEVDIERGRPASLAIVPDSPRDPPQVLAVALIELEALADVLVGIAERLRGNGPAPTPAPRD